MDQPLLELNGISKSFGGVEALRGVSFTLLPGEIHALVGENGAGKSTLIKVLAGAHRPDAGSIRLRGESTVFSSPRQAQAAGANSRSGPFLLLLALILLIFAPGFYEARNLSNVLVNMSYLMIAAAGVAAKAGAPIPLVSLVV